MVMLEERKRRGIEEGEEKLKKIQADLEQAESKAQGIIAGAEPGCGTPDS